MLKFATWSATTLRFGVSSSRGECQAKLDLYSYKGMVVKWSVCRSTTLERIYWNPWPWPLGAHAGEFFLQRCSRKDASISSDDDKDTWALHPTNYLGNTAAMVPLSPRQNCWAHRFQRTEKAVKNLIHDRPWTPVQRYLWVCLVKLLLLVHSSLCNYISSPWCIVFVDIETIEYCSLTLLLYPTCTLYC